jgi:hypothetical protein
MRSASTVLLYDVILIITQEAEKSNAATGADGQAKADKQKDQP